MLWRFVIKNVVNEMKVCEFDVFGVWEIILIIYVDFCGLFFEWFIDYGFCVFVGYSLDVW